jgi:hypothetical protein
MSKATKEKLFAVLSERLTLVEEHPVPTVRCPLCPERAFQYEAIAAKELTLEHIIPKSLGGNLFTLTCDKCNNSHGTERDHHLKSLVEARDGMEPDGKVRVKIATAGGVVTANLTSRSATKADPMTFTVLGKHTNPARIDELQASLKAGGELKIEMKFPVIRGAAYQALYKTAYLALFNELGYEYVLSHSAAAVRAALKKGDYSVLYPVLEAHVDGDPGPLLIVPFPAPVQAYLVVVRLSKGIRRYYAAMLPTVSVNEPAPRLNRLARALVGKLMTVGRDGSEFKVRLRPEYFSQWDTERRSN